MCDGNNEFSKVGERKKGNEFPFTKKGKISGRLLKVKRVEKRSHYVRRAELFLQYPVF